MFLGHIAMGFAGKRVAPKTSLGTLLLAPLFWTGAVPTMLILAGPTQAQSPATPSPSTIQAPNTDLPPRLAPAIVERLKQVKTAWVYEVDSLPSPGCTPRVSVLEDAILCHLVRSARRAPSSLWASDLASALGRSSVRSSDRPFRPDVGVRLLGEDFVTDVLISAMSHRILLSSKELALVEIVPDDPFRSILGILRRALPNHPAVRIAILEQEAWEARPSPGTSGLWPDCPPGVEEGQFVYYEDEPVPVQTVEPEWPKNTKREGSIKVTLHVFVEPSGRVCFAKVIKGSEPFASSAIEAARHWVFRPAMANGKPIGVWVELPLLFKP